MGSYTLTAGQRAAHAKTLVAATVDTVTFDSEVGQVEVLSHDGSSPIYFTVDGSTPTVAGAGTFVLPAAVGALEVPVAYNAAGGDTAVKLISAGTPTYSVTGR